MMAPIQVPVDMRGNAKRVARVDVERVLRIVAEHPSRKNAAEWPGSPLAPTPELWAGHIADPPQKDVYSIYDLLELDDVDFVRRAYRILFRRNPDDAGLQANVDALRAGARSKIQIIEALRFSPEGMRVGVAVKGIRAAILSAKVFRVPVAGPLLSWAREVTLLSRRITESQRRAAQQAERLSLFGHVFNRDVRRFSGRLEVLESSTPKAVDDLQRRVFEAEAAATALAGQVNDLQALLERFAEAATRARAEIDGLTRAKAESDLLGERERLLSNERGQTLDALYAQLESAFRGSRELIRQRVEPYLTIMTETGAGSAEAPIVDVGCGRGEWLELLKERGFVARGIDLNALFAAELAAIGIDITVDDAVHALSLTSADSLGAVTSMHLVEHLPTHALVKLIDQSLRALRPGGALILETPNPENLDVATLNFYMDPTHLHPLPPLFLQWLVGARGFERARIERLYEARDYQAPEPVAVEVPGAHAINGFVSRVRIAPDYAVVAYKPAAVLAS